jgi:hypothetical protein
MKEELLTKHTQGIVRSMASEAQRWTRLTPTEAVHVVGLRGPNRVAAESAQDECCCMVHLRLRLQERIY